MSRWDTVTHRLKGAEKKHLSEMSPHSGLKKWEPEVKAKTAKGSGVVGKFLV